VAFDAYVVAGGVGRRPRSGARRTTFAVSLAVHGTAIAVAVGYSFWHIEELSPPSVAVTFVSALAPPPAPPPPAALGGGSAVAAATPKRRPPPTVVRAQPKPELVQPRTTPPEIKKDQEKETPKPVPPAEEPKAATTAGPGTQTGSGSGDGAGSKPGVAGHGVAGGTGDTPGGAPVRAMPAKFLPPSLGALQRLAAPEPEFPVYLRHAGTRYELMLKICVSPTGSVDSVTLLKRAEPTLDRNVTDTVKRRWSFRPLIAGSTAVPFCYFQPFEFKAD